MPPPEPGVHPTHPPRQWGGNIDCNELGPGTTLYLPIPVDGALLSLGDAHARQGHSEASSTAIETPTEHALNPHRTHPRRVAQLRLPHRPQPRSNNRDRGNARAHDPRTRARTPRRPPHHPTRKRHQRRPRRPPRQRPPHPYATDARSRFGSRWRRPREPILSTRERDMTMTTRAERSVMRVDRTSDNHACGGLRNSSGSVDLRQARNPLQHLLARTPAREQVPGLQRFQGAAGSITPPCSAFSDSQWSEPWIGRATVLST
jgi:Acetamidase/Formamidase family